MKKPSEAEILRAEEELQAAMLTSDVVALEKLLSPDLVFTNHLGQRLSKEDDLSAHRSGMLRIESISRSEQVIRLLETAAVVSVRTMICGTYAGKSANGDFRFTRIWARGRDNSSWQVVAGHSTLLG